MAVQRFLPAPGLLALLAWPPATRSEENLSYRDLVQRMTDLSRPAKLPAVGETCQQWSSFDRASRYDEATGNPQAQKSYMFGIDRIELKPVR